MTARIADWFFDNIMTWSYCLHRRYSMSRQKNSILIDEHALNREPVPLNSNKRSTSSLCSECCRSLLLVNAQTYRRFLWSVTFERQGVLWMEVKPGFLEPEKVSLSSVPLIEVTLDNNLSIIHAIYMKMNWQPPKPSIFFFGQNFSYYPWHW